MPVLENLRLHELRIVVAQNKKYFDEFLALVQNAGYGSIHRFVNESDSAIACTVIETHFKHEYKSQLLNGIGDPYSSDKAKWYFITWLFRDAPAQRLEPMLTSVDGTDRQARQVNLVNLIRADVSPLFPDADSWAWHAFSEVMLARLEGSRRALKGGLFENVVRHVLEELFSRVGLNLNIADRETRLDDETYDVAVSGSNGTILIPVKTRETMGGGHALLFTRDIYKSITVATNSGNQCLPIVIAESWSGDLDSLPCDNFIYLQLNPNQLEMIKPQLAQELEMLVEFFRSVS